VRPRLVACSTPPPTNRGTAAPGIWPLDHQFKRVAELADVAAIGAVETGPAPAGGPGGHGWSLPLVPVIPIQAGGAAGTPRPPVKLRHRTGSPCCRMDPAGRRGPRG